MSQLASPAAGVQRRSQGPPSQILEILHDPQPELERPVSAMGARPSVPKVSQYDVSHRSTIGYGLPEHIGIAS